MEVVLYTPYSKLLHFLTNPPSIKERSYLNFLTDSKKPSHQFKIDWNKIRSRYGFWRTRGLLQLKNMNGHNPVTLSHKFNA